MIRDLHWPVLNTRDAAFLGEGRGGCFVVLLLLTFRETVHELRLVFSGRVAGFSAWRGFVAAAGIASVLVGIGALVPGASMVVTTIFMSALVVTLVTALVMSVYWCGEEVIGDPVSGRLDEIRARWDAERSFEFLEDRES